MNDYERGVNEGRREAYSLVLKELRLLKSLEDSPVSCQLNISRGIREIEAYLEALNTFFKNGKRITTIQSVPGTEGQGLFGGMKAEIKEDCNCKFEDGRCYCQFKKED